MSVVVEVQASFSSPAERVWDAWTLPSLASRFLFATRTGNVMHCEIEPFEGGHFLVRDRRPIDDGDESVMEVEHRGTFVVLERPRSIVFDVVLPALPDRLTRVDVRVSANGSLACTLALAHTLGDDAAAHAHAAELQRHWAKMLSMLEQELRLRRIGPGAASGGL